MPIRTITPMTMRMILRAPPPLLFVATAGGGGATATGWRQMRGSSCHGTLPHLLQNLVPSLSVAPQELQNAISHLAADDSPRRASIPQRERGQLEGWVRCATRCATGTAPRSRRDVRRYDSNRALAPGAGAVVGHGEGQEDEEEEYRGDYDQLQELFAGAFEVHKEERDQQRFRRWR